MSDGSQIKAGGVHFEIGANAKAFKRAVAASEKDLKSFGDRIAAAAAPAGARIGQQLTAGIIGAIGVNSLDQAIRALDEQIRKHGGRAGFSYGAAFTDEFIRVMESLPVAGAFGAVFNRWAKEKVPFLKTGAAFADIGDESRSRERTAAHGAAIDAFRSGFQFIEKATGELDEQTRLAKELEAIARRVEDSYRALGQPTFGARKADELRLHYAERLAEQAQRRLDAEEAGLRNAQERLAADRIGAAWREEEDRKSAIAGIVERLEREAADVGKSELERLRDRLVGMGAAGDLVARALQAQAAVESASATIDRRESAFGTFLGARLDQMVGRDPGRKLEDKVGRINERLEAILRELQIGTNGPIYGA